MSQPTISDVHVDAALTNLSVAYIQKPSNFVAGQVFPSVSVMNQSNKYHKFDKNDWFRDDAVQLRPPATESAGSGMGVSQGTYSCDVWSTHIDLGEQVLRNADPSVPLDRAAAELVTQRMFIRRERLFASNYFTTSIWGTDVTGGSDFTLWSDFGASDPQADIETGRTAILQNTGMDPNTLVVSHAVHSKLKQHPLVQERFKYTSSDSVTEAMLAKFFEVDRYIVSRASYSTSEESAASETYAFALGSNALLCYVAPNAGIMVPSAGYNFVWSNLTNLNNLGIRMKQFEITAKNCMRIEGDFAFDMNVVGSDLGYFFSGAVA